MTYISIYPNLCLWLTSTLRSSFEPIYFAVSLPQRRLLHAIALHVLGNTSEVQKPAAQPTCTSQHPQEGHSAPLSARTRGMQMTNIKIWLADFGGVIFMYLYHPHDIFWQHVTCMLPTISFYVSQFGPVSSKRITWGLALVKGCLQTKHIPKYCPRKNMSFQDQDNIKSASLACQAMKFLR